MAGLSIQGVDVMVDSSQLGGVTEGSYAEAAGLEAGDVITSVNGTSISTWDDLVAAIGTYLDSGTDFDLTYVRDGMGPIGLPEDVRVCADASLRDSLWWTIGANESGYHYIHAKLGRDFELDDWVDVITVKEGDGCPTCGKPLDHARGIEVGQVFQLGTKYSASMGATFADENGDEQPFLMGSYGIGVGRTMQAIIEQHHDDAGICWPVCVAPYEVEVIPLDVADGNPVWEAGVGIADDLISQGVEVVLDDRKERPGVKFADADLIGLPYQVILGKRGVKNGTAEVKDRASGERTDVALSEVSGWLADKVIAQRA